ncbi:hypothetical protein E4L96_18275 [Massilia arenosa]|uniref:Penicillin-binding protein activator n=1 Tax=Zemynaea arenosa TaxID=2561931 RepID=A0A4Y9S273_9BURK|nr:hypothetical protein E4L96_18275 [Massilia arenosa]
MGRQWVSRMLALAACAAMLPHASGQPCGEPGRLCAPPAPVTSAPQSVTPRIALLLPPGSDALAEAADAVKSGFLAAREHDPAPAPYDVLDEGHDAATTRAAVATAAASHDILIGPLSRSAIAALASAPATREVRALRSTSDGRATEALPDPGHAPVPGSAPPTAGRLHILLNTPPAGSQRLPPGTIPLGLVLEDEGRQAANWASSDQPIGKALVVTGTDRWQIRLADTFTAAWRAPTRKALRLKLDTSYSLISDSTLNELPALLKAEHITLIFAALNRDQARDLRRAVGTQMPFYGTSSLNPGPDPFLPTPELNGARIVDVPWQTTPPTDLKHSYYSGQTDLDRLYALGADAYRLAKLLATRPPEPVNYDGLTGHLVISPTQATVERTEAQAVYHMGTFQPATGASTCGTATAAPCRNTATPGNNTP